MSYGTVTAKPASDRPVDESGDDQGASSPLLSDNEASGESNNEQVESRRSWKQNLFDFYQKNIGLVFVFLAQMFASVMSMTTRLLETGFETKFHALQVIFVRMLATAVIGSLYMWYKNVPAFPLGPPGVRKLLVLRGFAGSSGLFGLYYSLSYLDISDATIITFLVPTITAFVCWVALREPFTINEAGAGLIAFIGVLFIARPAFLFPGSKVNPELHVNVGGLLPPPTATPRERSIAIVCAIFGSFAAATAYATIRVIGNRAHSLVSVNYFAVLATVSSFLVIMIHPDLHFEVPQTTAQWILLVSIGVSGFLLQFLLTEGLQREKAGRATNLIYTQLVFALIIERVVWGTIPPLFSFIGSGLIIGAALWVSLQKNSSVKPASPVSDEERRLLGPQDDEERT